MAAKIQIKNDRINSFGGISFIIDQFRSSGLAALVDKILGIRGINTRYSYSNVIENLTSVFVSGGEVVEFYNQRGTSERTFDMQNNDFGWKRLPFSFMKENTVFMILTALIRNFYVWLVGKIAAKKAFGLEATSRVKKFVFRFVQVPFRWVFRSRQWHLQLFTSRPYNRLRL